MTPMHEHDQRVSARCPRCDYDQRGVIATWTNQCPLQGICAECGLKFEWREVLNPTFSLPNWCVEARQSIPGFPMQMVHTTARVWFSPLLWRSLRMVHALSRPRLTAWMVTWLAILVATLAVSNGLATLGNWAAVTAPAGARPALVGSASGSQVFMQAMLLPFSGRSIGTYSGGGMAMGYTPPQHALRFWILGRTSWPLLVLLAVPICCGAAFAALPISRRRAKVRWRHILRATVYAYGLACLTAMLLILRQSMVIWTEFTGAANADPILALIDVLATVVPGVATAIFIGFIPALVAYWHACTKRYLHMEHPWAVATSVTLLGMLAPVAVGGFTWYLFD
jgi:hypothetical protein